MSAGEITLRGKYWRLFTLPDGTRLRNIGVSWETELRLHNPNGYPESQVREALLLEQERRHARRSAGAKRAAVTRARRRELALDKVVGIIAGGGTVGPQDECFFCARRLTDPESVARGIGSECWQGVLTRLQQRREQQLAQQEQQP